MGIFDKLFGKEKPKTETEQKVGGLDLTKKMELNFNKLNLDKPEVLEQTLFILDISGSMMDSIDGRRKIDHLRDVMKKYPNAEKICFSHHVWISDEIPEPNGSTDLAMAFRYVRDNNISKRIVLISDGEPNDKTEALKEAKKLSHPVDIIFIGEEDSNGGEFMEKVAKETGGQHFIV